MSSSPQESEVRPPAPIVRRDERGRLLPGATPNPGGVSKQKRQFLDRLKNEDADEVYRALMKLVAERNVPAVLRCAEYIAGKPKESIELSTAPESKPLDLGRLTLEQLENLQKLLAAATNGGQGA